jgi:site-specific recombinase XerD
MFLEYLTDPRYGWREVCAHRFGQVPQQVLDEWNTVVHTSDYEGRPGRRPLSYEEVQRLFDAADDLVDLARVRRRKGALAAQRDAALLKTVYAFGLRRREAWGLDLVDLRANPKVRAFGRCGAVMVRWGKSQRGGPPRRRTVMLVPEMDWVTERRSRLDWRGINAAFAEARDAAGLDRQLDLHCLRHSYVTHLVEFDYPERFVQEQVGHAYAATTAIYTGVSDAYRNTLLRRAISAHQPDLWRDDVEEGTP